MGLMLAKTQTQLEGIRKSCKITSSILDEIGKAVRPGVMTKELENIAKDIIKTNNARSAFYRYGGGANPYPGYICVSVNDEVVHGIPGERIVQDGDVISVDVGVELNGYYSDAARTFIAGKTTEEIEALVEITKKALENAIPQCKEGNTVRDISKTVYESAKAINAGVVRDLVGHGVGLSLHEPPQIPNFVFKGANMRLVRGMTLAVEPMFTNGDYRVYVDRKDGWTVRTKDGSIAAHFENTILVGENGGEILTGVN
jgi:methionyl aminopeptidase